MDSETSTKEPWKEKLKRHWMQTRLAHEGMMIGKIQDQNKVVLDNAKRCAGGEPTSGDDMSDVSIGNEVHNHYETSTSSTEKSGMSPLAKVLIAAVLVASGASIGASLGYMAASSFTDTDTDTKYQYDGGLGSPPTNEAAG